jgi:hypothetical protein
MQRQQESYQRYLEDMQRKRDAEDMQRQHMENLQRQQDAERERIEAIQRQQQEQQIQKQQTHISNPHNCPGMMDYSPFAPTDTLNVHVSPAVATVLASSAVAAVVKSPGAGLWNLGINLPGAIVGDAVGGNTSVSVSITGHDGDTFGHSEIP